MSYTERRMFVRERFAGRKEREGVFGGVEGKEEGRVEEWRVGGVSRERSVIYILLSVLLLYYYLLFICSIMFIVLRQHKFSYVLTKLIPFFFPQVGCLPMVCCLLKVSTTFLFLTVVFCILWNFCLIDLHMYETCSVFRANI